MARQTDKDTRSPIEREWKDHARKYAADDFRATKTLLSTYLATFVLACSFKYLDHVHLVSTYFWSITFLFSLAYCTLMLRHFMIFHDCCHDSFFSTTTANRITGHLQSFFAITPFKTWRRRHLYHHSHAGDLDVFDEADSLLFTKQQFDLMSPPKRIFYRIARDPVIFFPVVPLVLWWMKYPTVDRSLAATAGLCYSVYVAFYHNMWYYLIGTYIASIIGLLLFHLQHAVNSGYRSHQQEWSFFLLRHKVVVHSF